MTRRMIAASCGWLLLFALVVKLVGSIGRPVSWSAMLGAAAIIYGATAIIPAIIWAFRRFRAQKAILPLAVWAALLIIASTASLIRDDGSAIFAAAMNNAAFKKSYNDSFLRQANASCVTSAKAAAPNLADAQIHAYCDCSAAEMATAFTTPEMLALLAQKVDAAMRAKVVAIAAKCRGNAALRAKGRKRFPRAPDPL